MEAALKTYGSKKILDITYSTAEETGHNWEKMIAEAKRICGVGNERCSVIFTQSRTREVLNDTRR